MFDKKLIVTKHAMERFEERQRDMLPKDEKLYKANPEKYIKSLLRPLNIKKMTKNGNNTIVITRNNYRIVIKEVKDKAIIKTVIRVNARGREKFFK